MILYRIKNWDERYENNRSRRVKDLQWVPTPNHHDGDGTPSEPREPLVGGGTTTTTRPELIAGEGRPV